MGAVKNLTGEKFAGLTVIEKEEDYISPSGVPLISRINKRHWTIERALTTPMRKRKEVV